jgi:transposase InsO family protein
MPNETWQSDFTHYRLATGADTQIITWLDDHSRYALHVSAHVRITAATVVATFTQAASEHGYPASTLTDNGTVYTTRFAGGRGGRNHLEHELRRRHVNCPGSGRGSDLARRLRPCQHPARTRGDPRPCRAHVLRPHP